MALVTLKNISIRFGAEAILDNVNWVIEAKQRIGLIGRNGAGKSTLLRLLDKTIEPDEGEISFSQSMVSGRLLQEVPVESDLLIKSAIAQGHKDYGTMLADAYQSNTEPTDDRVWQFDRHVQTLCSKFDLNGDADFADLSGGQKRRVYLARALVQEPDLLLLDEPTNHLDIDTIIWLENLLANLNCTLIMVSHDRAFIDRLCTQIVEIDRGQLSFWPGNFSQYLRGKEKALEQETRHHAKFDKKLAQEEAWIRQGIQARRTRNEGRVRALKKMREQRQQRRAKQGDAQFNLNQAEKSGRLVVEAKNINHSFADEPLIQDFSARILRGDKVGIIGANGCGKSTLINILTGELLPTGGTVRLGSRLQIAYLDQLRSTIQNHLSVQDNVSGNTEVTINGQSQHIMSYLQTFLFSPARARAPAEKLSGGERNRLMLAKLFTQPFNLLVLDEPTNDLDYETLELLEQLLIDYQGTLLLVSHDRTFINNIVTSTIAFEGDGRVVEYIGGYDDWLRQRPDTANEVINKPVVTKQKHNTDGKLSYKYQRELAMLPDKMDALEKQIMQIQQAMLAADFYQQEPSVVTETTNSLKQYEQELELCFQRWEELEAMAKPEAG